ncbi:hypothetical protein D3C85_1615970 [compost metagenome]
MLSAVLLEEEIPARFTPASLLVLIPSTAMVNLLLFVSTIAVFESLEQLVINVPGIASIAIATTQ